MTISVGVRSSASAACAVRRAIERQHHVARNSASRCRSMQENNAAALADRLQFAAHRRHSVERASIRRRRNACRAMRAGAAGRRKALCAAAVLQAAVQARAPRANAERARWNGDVATCHDRADSSRRDDGDVKVLRSSVAVVRRRDGSMPAAPWMLVIPPTNRGKALRRARSPALPTAPWRTRPFVCGALIWRFLSFTFGVSCKRHPYAELMTPNVFVFNRLFFVPTLLDTSTRGASR